jgi:hypothetical protein
MIIKNRRNDSIQIRRSIKLYNASQLESFYYLAPGYLVFPFA